MKEFFDIKENFDIDEGFHKNEFFASEDDERNEEEIDISSLRELGIKEQEETFNWSDLDVASLKDLREELVNLDFMELIDSEEKRGRNR